MVSELKLEQIIDAAQQIAVATLTEDGTAPDVRIVLGVYDKLGKQVLFMSSRQAEKVAEIAAHGRAAFATPQFDDQGVVRVRHAHVAKITPTTAQSALYQQKYPQTAKFAAHSDFFALTFDEADVTINGETTTVKITD
ncbi:pyridoxamine 5'-phosphate oxidase family protein [Lacticaseibacillus baoqingensis]|uniref:Pyridoxamine 5'-phosphate oxidase family protein n=1 Tax=Lacticaseibacillus baoqingensis TaxID=2486013 RepID=A0ABW4E4J3_9LACO